MTPRREAQGPETERERTDELRRQASAALLHRGGMKRTCSGSPVDPAAADSSETDSGDRGREAEFEDYTSTASSYDAVRRTPALWALLGAAASGRVPLAESDVLELGCGSGNYLHAVKPVCVCAPSPRGRARPRS